MTAIIFDTETNGFISPKCRIVQLAAIVVDYDTDEEIASLNVIIKPDDWEIPEVVSHVHGITTEKANRFGIPIRTAMAMFSNLCKISDLIVAHNYQFDRQVVTLEFDRLQRPNIPSTMQQVCTMLATTSICKIPQKRGGFKWPKLIEAHQHFFGEGFDGAHDALVDVRACHRVHRHLIKNNLI